MSVVSRGCRLLQQSARLSPGLSLAGREVGAPGGGGRGLFGKAGGATGGKSQSKVLSSPSDGIAHIEVLTLKPEFKEDYLKLAAEHVPQLVENREIPINLVGAWTTLLGKKSNTATHIWEYKCFDDVSQSFEKMASDKSWQEFVRVQAKFLDGTSNQIVLPFTFFQSSASETTPTTESRQKRVFEMRSYDLKPGSMIEWGQEWAKGIQYRREEAVGGWFSQIGHMHSVYHLWVYKSLQDREEIRHSAWAFPGWDECVRITVPLIQEMESTILLPTSYSPLQ